jgi:DNA-binding response OmpR family regulator
MGKRIFLVDDDALMRRSLAFNLEQAGYRTTTFETAEDALGAIRQEPPDLVLLDIGLPGMDGLEALKCFREQCRAPIFFLTARHRELDEILGLELGADDYITKPFDKDVLLARVRTALRRVSEAEAPIASVSIQAGDLTIDPEAHTAVCRGRTLVLSPREFDLLHTLIREAGHVVRTDDLLARVWGAEFDGQPQVLYVHIRWLREKIEEDPDHPQRILTVRGRGYKLIPREG